MGETDRRRGWNESPDKQKRPKRGEGKALRDSRPVRNGPASRNAQPQTDKSGIRVGKRKKQLYLVLSALHIEFLLGIEKVTTR